MHINFTNYLILQKFVNRTKLEDLRNLFGMMFSAILFLGGTSALNVQTVIASERTVFYREKAARMYSPFPFALAQVIIFNIDLLSSLHNMAPFFFKRICIFLI